MKLLHLILCLIVLILIQEPLVGQSHTGCSSDEHSHFDYMLGHWYGVQYVYQNGDTVQVGTTELEVSKRLNGCVNREIMDVHSNKGDHVFNGIVLRSYYGDKNEWRFTEVDDRGRHYFFTSKKEDDIWKFYNNRERDGRKYILRLSYPRISEDHFQQIFERSYDEGKTWRRRSHIDFYRDKPHPK